MTTITIVQSSILSRIIQADSRFVQPFVLFDYTHMQEVLGGECKAIELPQDIIIWCAADCSYNPYEHSLTIQKGIHKEFVFGNAIITSSDNDSLAGIRSLSDKQTEWLRDNLKLVESELHGNYVLKFDAA